MAVINSAALDPTTVVMRMCVCVWCVCMHVCDELHCTSPIGLSQGRRHSSVPRHKAWWWTCLLLTIRRTRSPLKQHPRGQAMWVQTPRGAEYVDIYCLYTCDAPRARCTATLQSTKQGAQVQTQHRLSLHFVGVCVWMCLTQDASFGTVISETVLFI